MATWLEGVPSLSLGLLFVLLAGFLLVRNFRQPVHLACASLLAVRGGFSGAVGLLLAGWLSPAGKLLAPGLLLLLPFVEAIAALAFLRAGLRRSLGARAATWGLAVAGLATVAAFGARPGLFGPPAVEGTVGPLSMFVGVEKVVAAALAAILAHRYLYRPPGPHRRPLVLASLAFAMEPAFVGASALAQHVAGANLYAPDFSPSIRLLWALSFLVVLGAMGLLASKGLWHREPGERSRAVWSLVVLAGAALSAVAASLLFLASPSAGARLDQFFHAASNVAAAALLAFGVANPMGVSLPARERYRIERELGVGGSGRAILATDLVHQRKVVLKQPFASWLLDRASRERFVREARLLQAIRHPHVVELLELREDEDPPLLVLEYVPGGSLDARLRKTQKLPEDEARRIVLGVLQGLQAIHSAGVVHRDLKPANVLLDADGEAKVADLGIAQAPRGPDAPTFTRPAAQAGSPAYMSPEQARGEDVDLRTDLYAVGVLLYRCLSGRHYLDLEGEGDAATRERIQTESARLPARGIPAPVARVLERALAKSRAKRYSDAAEMATELRAAWPGPAGMARAAAPDPARRPKPSQGP